MESIFEASKPYLESIALALISLIAAVVTAAMFKIRSRVLEWIESKTTKEQREILYRISEEAFSYVEAEFHAADGDKKLREAADYVINNLNKHGIDLSLTEIYAAIEKVVLEHKKETED